jgi:hypothetical protein
MRAKSDWERVRSPHARFLEGLQAAVANHPSASARGGVNTDRRSATERATLTVVGSIGDNVIPLPTDRPVARRKPRVAGRTDRGGSPAA